MSETGIILLTARSIEMLLDLVEMKIGQMEVADVEDSRDFKTLKLCRAELKRVEGHRTAAIMPQAAPPPRPGRPRRSIAPAAPRAERFVALAHGIR